MKLLAFTFLLLIALDDSYCTHTSSSNKSSAVWGYQYSQNNNTVYNVKHDDDGYRLEPISNATDTDYKKHYNSWLVADIYTSPDTSTNDSQHSSTGDLFSGTSNFTPGFESNSSGADLFNGNETALEPTKGLRTGPSKNAHAINVEDIQLGIPTVPEIPSQRTIPWLRAPEGVQPGVPSNGLLQTTIILPGYESQFTSPFSIPTGPLYFTTYSPMYGLPAGSNYGIPNGPTFWSQNGQMFDMPTGPINGYRPQYNQNSVPLSGPMPSYGPLSGPINGYRPHYYQNSVPQFGPTPSYGPLPGPMDGYRPQYGQNSVPPTGPLGEYGPQTGQTHGPLAGPMNGYRPPNGQNNVPSTGPSSGYGPQTGQNNIPPTGPTNGYGPMNGQTYSPHVIYPTKSSEVSHRYNY